MKVWWCELHRAAESAEEGICEVGARTLLVPGPYPKADYPEPCEIKEMQLVPADARIVSGSDDVADALIRARQTQGQCRAAVWMKNRRTDEWYEWSTCTGDPGHGGPHEIWSERDSDTFWHPWNDGDAGVDEYHNYGEVIRTEWRTGPSPWTAAEIACWNEPLLDRPNNDKPKDPWDYDP